MSTKWEDYKAKHGLENNPIKSKNIDLNSSKTKSVRPWDFLNPNTEYVNDEVANMRYEECLSCDRLIQLTKQCKECGCFMQAKTKLAGATCPLGKW